MSSPVRSSTVRRLRLTSHQFIASLRANSRRRWLVTFVLLSIVGSFWALGDPLFAPADEASHTIRAAAVSRGQFTGTTLTAAQAGDRFRDTCRVYS